MSAYVVEGYRLIRVMLKVKASSAEDALERAKAGYYEDVDTEPFQDTKLNQWTAKPLLSQEKANG
jgi:hypothetical protein